MGDYGFWLYSAMTQATAALFGVIGMFIIFRLQLLKDKIKDEERAVLGVLHRIGLNYSALEKKTFEEVEEFLANEIKQREDTEKIDDKEAQRLVIDKEKIKRELDLLKDKREDLKTARDNYTILVRDGKEAMKGLGVIFGFSVVLLIVKPLLEKIGFIFLTVVYTSLLAVIFENIWRLMRETLT